MLYLNYLKMHIYTLWEYRWSTILLILSQFFMAIVMLFGMHILFLRFGSIGGYRESEVLLSASIVIFSASFGTFLFRGFDSFHTLIQNGTFDRILLRPRSEILQVMGTAIDVSRIGGILSSILIFVFSLNRCEIVWTVDKIFVLCGMLIGGFLCFFGIFLLNAGIVFRTIEPIEVMNIMVNGMNEFARYPVSVYGRVVQNILTYVIPIGMFQLLPLQYLLGKSNELLYAVAPVGTIPFWVFTFAVWRSGIRNHTSTGS